MLRCASFFAGVGGIDLGFEQNKLFKVVYANEFDPYPVKTYELNSKLKVDCRDIKDVKASEIPILMFYWLDSPAKRSALPGTARASTMRKAEALFSSS